MGSPIDRLSSQLAGLPNSDDKKQALGDILITLNCIAGSSLQTVDQKLSLSPVFDCLVLPDKEEVGLSCQVLEKLVSYTSPITLITLYLQDIIKSLNHGNKNIKEILLSEISKYQQKEDVMYSVFSEEVLLSSIIKCIGDDSLSTAKHACSIIKHIGFLKNGRKVLFTSSNLDSLNKILTWKDEAKFRLYEIIVSISCGSEEAFFDCMKCGILLTLFSELDNDDILIKLNSLELIGDLAVAEHCLIYLDKHDYLKKIEKIIVEKDNNPFFSFLLPGLMKFFGSVAHNYPKMILKNYPAFTTMMFNSLELNDESIKCIALETLGVIALSADGKKALSDQGSEMTDCLRVIGKLAKVGVHETRLTALRTIANLIQLQSSEQTSETYEITMKWFESLHDKPLQMIYENCELPFLDLRVGSFLILQALAGLLWGQKLLNNLAGFKEYLLNRTVESDKVCKEEKFKIINIIVESPTFSEVFDAETCISFKRHFNEGPFYVETVTEVAIEES